MFSPTYTKLLTLPLDKVSGGNNGEYKEIRKLLPKIEYIDEYDTHQGVVLKGKASRYMNPDEVCSWLKEKLGIDAEIDVGGALNPLSSAGKPNVYTRGGKSLTHSKVIAEIHNYLGD